MMIPAQGLWPGRIRVAVVDDEPLAREWLRRLLAGDDEMAIVAEYCDGKSAIAGLQDQAVDVVFLDIQMPEADGFDVLASLHSEEPPIVVFVTAYDEYAIRAFEAHALDYLLKPFDESRFRAALFRVKREVRRDREGLSRRLSMLVETLCQDRNHAERLAVHMEGRIILVPVAEVDWIEAADNYARVHVGRAKYLLRETLTSLAARLDQRRFLRIHRSTIVNTDRVREVQPLFRGEHVMLLHDGTRLTVGRKYRGSLARLLGDGP